MAPKRKKNTKTTKSEEDEEVVKAGSHVYVLTLQAYDHAGGNEGVEIVGIYNSKNAAVASAGDVDTQAYGTFDEAMQNDYSDSHEDHRDAAPDSGLLLKIGDSDEGEGDNVQLFIKKTEILGMPQQVSSKKKKNKVKKNEEESIDDLEFDPL